MCANCNTTASFGLALAGLTCLQLSFIAADMDTAIARLEDAAVHFQDALNALQQPLPPSAVSPSLPERETSLALLSSEIEGCSVA